MRAIVYERYGPPDVLELKDVEKPIPKDNEILVKVYAVSVNAADWHLLRADPFLVRLMAGLLKPKYKILGGDIAGRVEAVGRNIKQFQPGDEVFGDLSACGFGGFAEYVCASEDTLVAKPNDKDLVFMKELLEAGKVVPVIDRRYTLNEVAEAIRYFEEGHAKGKVVITMEHNNKT